MHLLWMGSKARINNNKKLLQGTTIDQDSLSGTQEIPHQTQKKISVAGGCGRQLLTRGVNCYRIPYTGLVIRELQ